MPFSINIKEEVLCASGRCCSICHKFCGIKIEVHHIKKESDGGENTFDNAIPLCFDCHADMISYDPQHPKGNRYTEKELKKHRTFWYEKVKGNVGIADIQATVDTDKKVYSRLLDSFPFYWITSYLEREDEFILIGISNFIQLCKNPAFEFIDPDLESLRSRLQEFILSFMAIHSDETSLWGELDTVARSIAVSYSALIRTGTRKLGILPREISGLA